MVGNVDIWGMNRVPLSLVLAVHLHHRLSDFLYLLLVTPCSSTLNVKSWQQYVRVRNSLMRLAEDDYCANLILTAC